MASFRNTSLDDQLNIFTLKFQIVVTEIITVTKQKTSTNEPPRGKTNNVVSEQV